MRTTTQENAREAKKRRRALLRSWGSDDGLTCLEYFESHFETHLPVFQGKCGSFDPLDAMRRDAYREVFLYIRHQLKTAQKEHAASEEIRDLSPLPDRGDM